MNTIESGTLNITIKRFQGMSRAHRYRRVLQRFRFRMRWLTRRIYKNVGVSTSLLVRKTIVQQSYCAFILGTYPLHVTDVAVYIVKLELMNVQLASLSSSIDEGLQVTMFVERFGDRSRLAFSAEISVLMVKKDLSWESLTACLLQKHIWQQVSQFPNDSIKDLALAASYQNGSKSKKKTITPTVMLMVAGSAASLVILRLNVSRESQTRRT